MSSFPPWRTTLPFATLPNSFPEIIHSNHPNPPLTCSIKTFLAIPTPKPFHLRDLPARSRVINPTQEFEYKFPSQFISANTLHPNYGQFIHSLLYSFSNWFRFLSKSEHFLQNWLKFVLKAITNSHSQFGSYMVLKIIHEITSETNISSYTGNTYQRYVLWAIDFIFTYRYHLDSSNLSHPICHILLDLARKSPKRFATILLSSDIETRNFIEFVQVRSRYNQIYSEILGLILSTDDYLRDDYTEAVIIPYLNTIIDYTVAGAEILFHQHDVLLLSTISLHSPRFIPITQSFILLLQNYQSITFYTLNWALGFIHTTLKQVPSLSQ
jgi:hypothetical protein